jgi:hypothetical protein
MDEIKVIKPQHRAILENTGLNTVTDDHSDVLHVVGVVTGDGIIYLFNKQ